MGRKARKSKPAAAFGRPVSRFVGEQPASSTRSSRRRAGWRGAAGRSRGSLQRSAGSRAGLDLVQLGLHVRGRVSSA